MQIAMIGLGFVVSRFAILLRELLGARAHRLTESAGNWVGVLLVGAAFALIFNVSQSLQTALGGYTRWAQHHTEDSSGAQKRLAALKGGGK